MKITFEHQMYGPNDEFDWRAFLEDDKGEYVFVGRGITKQTALDDLKAQIHRSMEVYVRNSMRYLKAATTLEVK